MEICPLREQKRPSWREIGWVTLSYVVLTAILTYPVILNLSSWIAGYLGDELLGLYMCREWMHSLAEGRLPTFCPDIGRPYGIPFAFTSLHQYQAAVYMLLHPFCNDTLIHNILVLSSFVLAGLGGYLLVRELLGDARASFLAGLIYSFAAPHAMNAWGHTSTMTLQWIPFFLLFWIRLVRKPDWPRLLLAVLFFVLAACSEPYQAIFCTLLGVLYLLFYWWFRRERGSFPYATLVPWLALFCVLVLLVLVLPFWPLIWMSSHGYKISWPFRSFLVHSVPPVAWLVPSKYHLLGQIYTLNYLQKGVGFAALCSYHGLLAVLLVFLVVALRVRFQERAYLISAFAICVFLSWASVLHWRGYSFYQYLPVLKSMRSPNRFNIPGGLLLAVIAAAGFIAVQQYGVRFLEKRGCGASVLKFWERGWFLFAIAFLSIDLCIAPFPVARIPDLPHFFRTYPPPAGDECILEVPAFYSGSSDRGGLTTYWQSYHRWPTSGGHMAYHYMPYNYIWLSSPFGLNYFLDAKSKTTFKDIVDWDCKSFLDAHKVRYVVLHATHPTHMPLADGVQERLSTQLRAWMQASPIYKDSAITVYDPGLVDPARGCALVLKDGFYMIQYSDGHPFRWSKDRSRIALLVRSLSQGSICFRAMAFQRPRELRALVNGKEVGHWRVPTEIASFSTEPFYLEEGEHELVFLAGGSDKPLQVFPASKDTRDFSICFYEIKWTPSEHVGKDTNG